MALDEQIYRAVGSFYGKSAVLDFFMLLFELNLLRYVLIALMLSVWLSKRPEMQRGAILAMASVVCSVMLRPIFKHIVYVPRPWIENGCPGLAPCYPDSSFPSGHEFLACAMTVVLWRADRRAGVVMSVLAVCIGISRIYLGEHWPSDLLAGGAMGAATGYALTLLAAREPFRGWLDRAVQLSNRLRFWRRLPAMEPAAAEAAV